MKRTRAIHVPEELWRRLTLRAKGAGQGVQEHALGLLETTLRREVRRQAIDDSTAAQTAPEGISPRAPRWSASQDGGIPAKDQAGPGEGVDLMERLAQMKGKVG